MHLVYTTPPNSETQTTNTLLSPQVATHSGYVTSYCSHTSVVSGDLGADSLFLDSRGESQFGSPSPVKDGFNDGEGMVCIAVREWKAKRSAKIQIHTLPNALHPQFQGQPMGKSVGVVLP